MKLCFPELINRFFRKHKLPYISKLSDITPVFEKLDLSNKADYRPVRILPLLSKTFEKIIYDQLYEYIKRFLNQVLYGFCKKTLDTASIFQTFKKMAEKV